LVAHTSGGREVAGSSPVIPTERKSKPLIISSLDFFFLLEFVWKVCSWHSCLGLKMKLPRLLGRLTFVVVLVDVRVRTKILLTATYRLIDFLLVALVHDTCSEQKV